jgi:hypothetical protein
MKTITFADLDKWQSSFPELHDQLSSWFCGDRPGMTILEIVDLPVDAHVKILVATRPDVLTLQQTVSWLEIILPRAVKSHALHCGIDTVEQWATKWLSGEDRDTCAVFAAGRVVSRNIDDATCAASNAHVFSAYKDAYLNIVRFVAVCEVTRAARDYAYCVEETYSVRASRFAYGVCSGVMRAACAHAVIGANAQIYDLFRAYDTSRRAAKYAKGLDKSYKSVMADSRAHALGIYTYRDTVDDLVFSAAMAELNANRAVKKIDIMADAAAKKERERQVEDLRKVLMKG